MTDIFNTAAVKASGLDADHPRAAVFSTRDDIMTMTHQAHDAALCLTFAGTAGLVTRGAMSRRWQQPIDYPSSAWIV